jgi:hypothetical protein
VIKAAVLGLMTPWEVVLVLALGRRIMHARRSQLRLCGTPPNTQLCCSRQAHAPMTEKQRRLGSGLMPSSVSAREMMVDIWPRKNRTLVGATAPGRDSTASSALRSCECSA